MMRHSALRCLFGLGNLARDQEGKKSILWQVIGKMSRIHRSEGEIAKRLLHSLSIFIREEFWPFLIFYLTFKFDWRNLKSSLMSHKTVGMKQHLETPKTSKTWHQNIYSLCVSNTCQNRKLHSYRLSQHNTSLFFCFLFLLFYSIAMGVKYVSLSLHGESYLWRKKFC